MACGADTICIAVIDIPQSVEIVGRTKPAGGRVTRRTGNGKSGGDVIRYRPGQCHGVLPIGGVATIAIQWRRSGTGVAKIAGHRGVRAG